MIFPEPLKKGDNVFLFCPSSPIIPEEDIEKCKKVIIDLGFNPVIGKSLYENYGGYMAGKAEIRIEDLHEAFSRKDIKGIFCVKGGYSASQLLDKIDSDVTNLHIVFNQKCNLGTYHGPMVKSNMINDFNEYTKTSFFEAMEKNETKYEEPENMPLSILTEGNTPSENISGVLTGGNMAIIVTTLGTQYEIDTKGKILFLEDVDEEIGSLNRMLTHLKYAGKFSDCKAVVFGNFVVCKNTYTKENQHYELLELLKDFFADYDKPVIYGMESGHKKPYMFTLPLGAKCSINLQNKKVLFEK